MLVQEKLANLWKNRPRPLAAILRVSLSIQRRLKHPIYKWMTGTDIALYETIEHLRLDTKHEHVTLENLDRIYKNKIFYEARGRRLGYINTVLVILLLMTFYDIALNVTFLGFRFEDLHEIREILLATSALISASQVPFFLAANIAGTFIYKAITSSYPEPYRKLYRLMYLDINKMFAGLYDPGTKVFEEEIVPTLWYLRTFLAVTLLGAVILMLFLAIIIFVHVLIIYDIWVRPTLPIGINRTVIGLVIFADIFTFMSAFFLTFPLRFRNYRLVRQILSARSEAEKVEIMRAAAQDSRRDVS